MRIALAQIRSTTSPRVNLALVTDAARQAVQAGADAVVFPEATMCSFLRPPAQIAEPFDGPWASAVRELARELGITVVAGMFTTAPGGLVHNTLLATGGTEARYDKIHLFDALGNRESEHVAPVISWSRCRWLANNSGWRSATTSASRSSSSTWRWAGRG